jgi:hypothetical protein
MKQQMSCRDMELLYRQRAVSDSEHSWRWLGEAERWGHLAQRETASRFKEIGPMANGTEHYPRRFTRYADGLTPFEK